MSRRKGPYHRSHQENPSADKDNAPSADQSNHAVAKAILTLENTIAEKADTSREESRREDRGNKLIEIATLVFVVLTTAGIFYQAYILNSSDEAIHKSATAAKDAADAARSSVETTRAIMELDQRAWLGVESIRPDPLIPEIGKPLVVAIKIKNTGKTPARKIVSRGRGEAIPEGGKLNFSYDNIDAFAAHLMPGGDATTTVAPMTSPGTNTSIVVNKDILDALNAGTVSAFVHGRFEYEDIFGNPHWVTYCANLFVPFNGQFGFCPDHNDTDDYLPRKN